MWLGHLSSCLFVLGKKKTLQQVKYIASTNECCNWYIASNSTKTNDCHKSRTRTNEDVVAEKKSARFLYFRPCCKRLYGQNCKGSSWESDSQNSKVSSYKTMFIKFSNTLVMHKLAILWQKNSNSTIQAK